MAIAVPYDDEAVDVEQPQADIAVPYVAPPPLPTPSPEANAAWNAGSPGSPTPEAPKVRPGPYQPGMSEAERQRALKKAKLQMESANEEVERLKPTLDKILLATGMNLQEGAVGATKQAAGNLLHDYTDIVAPTKPHEPGSFKYFLQAALKPFDQLGPWLDIANKAGQAGLLPVSVGEELKTAGMGLAEAGTKRLKEAEY